MTPVREVLLQRTLPAPEEFCTLPDEISIYADEGSALVSLVRGPDQLVVYYRNLPALRALLDEFMAECRGETAAAPVPPVAEQQECSVCGRLKDATRQYFHLRNAATGELDTRCKLCKHAARVTTKDTVSAVDLKRYFGRGRVRVEPVQPEAVPA